MKNANTIELNGTRSGATSRTRIGPPILVENDANCFALAEALHGAGRGARCVFGVILGTGVGGGIVLDGRIWSGAQGIAGEWGHMTLDPDGPALLLRPARVRRDVPERTGDGAALSRRTAARMCTAAEIWSRAAAGETPAREAVEDVPSRFGFALAQVVNLLDPDVIVLGGASRRRPALPRMRPR